MSERFESPCPQCGTQVAVSTEHVGKKGRCPACRAVFPITAPVELLPELSLASPLRPLPPGLEPLPPGFQASAVLAPAAPGASSLFDGLGKPPPKPASDALAPSPEPCPVAAAQASDQVRQVFQRLAEKEHWQQERVREHLNGVMWMGVGMMAMAAVWFCAGLYFGIVFFRDPPILFVVGLGAFIKGLLRYSG
jgi:hypothetical protein